MRISLGLPLASRAGAVHGIGVRTPRRRPALPSPADNRRGILAMLAAMALFSANDTLLKVASADLPPGEIMAVRGAFATLTALGLVLATGERGSLGRIGSPLVLLRAAVEASVAFLYITSLAFLPLASITAILLASPIIMTLITVALGIETVGWRRWAAILVGFAGVLAIVRPTPSGFDLYAGLAFASTVLVAVRDLITRRIGTGVPSVVVTLSTTAAVTLAGLALGLREEWRPLDPWTVALLASAALLVTLGNLAIVLAFRVAEVSVVSPFRYAVVILSIVLGYLVFGEWPDLVAMAGIGLIVGSGVYTIHREHARTRQGLQRIASAPQDGAERR